MFINAQQAPHTSLKPINFILWFTLSFQAGTLNVGGFLACHRFVTHVTGFATHLGIDLTTGQFLEALSMLMVPIFFLLGCMTSALIIDRQKYLQKKPYYTYAFLFTGFSLFIISLLGINQIIGDFGNISSPWNTFVLLATLAFLSGMQNGMISLASGLLVRTTHLTGITTDLGVGIIRMFYPQVPSEQRYTEFKMNLLRCGTIFSFIIGSIIGGFTFYRWQYAGFLVPAFISFGLSIYSWNHHKKFDIKAPQGTPL